MNGMRSIGFMTIGIPKIIGSLILKITTDGEFPKLLHLLASRTEKHGDHERQCRAASADVDPDFKNCWVKIFGSASPA